MLQVVFSILIIALFACIGVMCLRDPEGALKALDRPLGEKHVRAMWLIGTGFLTVATMALFQLLRSLWTSN